MTKHKENILVVIPHLGIGGTEVQTLNLVKALSVGGYNVSVLCLYVYIPEVVRSFENAGANVILCSKSYDHYSDSYRFPTGVKLISFLFKTIKTTLRENKYGAIHLQYMTPVATMILLLRFVFNYRNIVVTSHTDASIYKSLKLLHFIQKHCCRVFTCITLNAENNFFGTSCLYNKDVDISINKHITIYNSLPYTMSIHNNVKEENITKKEYVIGVVSRLEPIKGMDFVIPAFSLVENKHHNVKLLIVGDGTLNELMHQQASQNHMEGKITWRGRLSQYELSDIYKQIDILLMPSRSEGFGLTAIEAMANGCVVVASNTGGLPEVVVDNYVGLLHESENIEDIANKVSTLLERPKLISAFRNNAINHIRKFSFEHYSLMINSLYSKFF